MTNNVLFMIVALSIAFILGLVCGLVDPNKRTSKPKFTPMRFTKDKQKVLIVKSVMAKKPEEMTDIRNSIQKQLKDGLVLLPCSLEYSFGEVTTDKVIYGEVENGELH